MFIFWVLIIVLIVILLKSSILGNNKNIGQNKSETPMEILKRRYAKGEITKEQYEEMKDRIKD